MLSCWCHPRSGSSWLLAIMTSPHRSLSPLLTSSVWYLYTRYVHHLTPWKKDLAIVTSTLFDKLNIVFLWRRLTPVPNKQNKVSTKSLCVLSIIVSQYLFTIYVGRQLLHSITMWPYQGMGWDVYELPTNHIPILDSWTKNQPMMWL